MAKGTTTGELEESEPSGDQGRASGPGADRDLQPLLVPESVAVLGASNDPARIGGRPLRYMLAAGYRGALYPVNPNRDQVQGLKAYPSIADTPTPADCAIVALPANLVVQAVRDCAARGVRSAVIFSSGFAESGSEGAALQAELSRIVADTGIRVVGPNCLGIFNAAVSFYATFTSSLDSGFATPGKIAIISQSGAYGSHVFAIARSKGLGVRYWLTTGNECDVNVAEGIAWAAQRDEIEVIVAYAEGVRDGPALCRSLAVARSRRKPVIFMKVGRSEIGAQAAASHTASLAGADAIYDAVFRQHGAHRARSTEEMIDLAYVSSAGVFPTGRRIGLVTISGGVGVQMADAADDLGFEVAAMPEAAQAALKQILPYAATRNPVDITAQAFNDIGLVSKNFRLMLDQGGYDVIVAFFTMVAASPYIVDDLLASLVELRRDFPDRSIVLSLVASPEVVRRYEEAGYPVFEDPIRALTAVSALCDFGASFARCGPVEAETRRADRPEVPDRPLSEHESKSILTAAGLPMVQDHLVRTADDAAEAAAALGLPVALKVNAAEILHKTEIGGVILNLGSFDAVREAYATLIERADRASGPGHDQVLVAPMVGGGVETILGIQVDPVFGPAVMLGLGGIFTEVLKDVVFRIAPFDIDEANRMIRELKGFEILTGLRGKPASDLSALAEALVGLSDFAVAAGDRISSVDINPFVVFAEGEGALGLDALVIPSSGAARSKGPRS